MPDQWERHGRGSKNGWDEWESIPARSQQRDAAAHDDPVHDHIPGKKNKDACKANHWGPHTIVYEYFNKSWYLRTHIYCEWTTIYSNGQYVPAWFCGHNGKCTGCGKSLGKPPVCPTRTRDDIEPPEWIIQQAKDDTMVSDARRVRWRPRIKGSSHYRKPKAR